MRVHKIIAAALLLCLVLSTAACSKQPKTDSHSNGSAAKPESLAPLTQAADYEAVRQLFVQAASNPIMKDDSAFGNLTSDPVAAETPNYAETNTQVEGVDEADIFKTDGSYLYFLDGSILRILRANGAQTEALSETEIQITNHYESFSGTVSELYLAENRVCVIADFSEWSYDEDGVWQDNSSTHVLIYDTTDKAAPKLLCDTAQDGNYLTSRMSDGIIYLVSNDYLYSFSADDTAERCIPKTYTNGEGKLIPAERIHLCPATLSVSYTVVSSISAADGTMLDSCAFTDSTSTVYMDGQGLYLARGVLTEGASEPFQENQYTVVDYAAQTVTEIKRLDVSGGKLELSATGTVPGSLLNQFAMDAYNGYLRVATTQYSYSYSIYTDEEYGFSNTVQHEDNTRSSLYVLDSTLAQVGAIDSLAAEERVYSVRFIGDMGYVVTYQSIDPVFTLNLSDPVNPTICSELEVAGVSEYLQSYGEGLLFGLGEAVDENAAFSGLQLSMFDISDASNVSLLAQATLNESYSEALYNHKAILVSQEKNLIAFPTGENSYLVYAYESTGFVRRGEFSLAGSDSLYQASNARGLFIGDQLYICGGSQVYVVDLESLTTVATVSFVVG